MPTRAFQTLEATGVDAALGIDDIPDKLEFMVKGFRDPQAYFALFRNSELVGKDSHVWFKDKVVTLYDDHDQVRKGRDKGRFCADDTGPALALAVLALNATTLGIPCIYDGSEQLFDGEGGNDRFIREAMSGGEFGPFRSRRDTSSGKTFRATAARPCAGRAAGDRRTAPGSAVPTTDLRHGGVDFGLPRRLNGRMRSVVAWSRIFGSEAKW